MKKISFIFILSAFLLSLAGCSKVESTPPEEVIEKTEKYKEKEKVEETIIPLEEVEKPEETGIIPSEDNPCGKEDPEEIEEESFLPDQNSYLEDDFFDLESYLYDCGANNVEFTETSCVATFYDWNIKIHSKDWSEIPELSIENELNGKDYYYDPSGDPNIGNFYEVNNNILICQSSINKLHDIITALYDSEFSFEPPVIYGFIYD